jgi:hypothetical protein
MITDTLYISDTHNRMHNLRIKIWYLLRLWCTNIFLGLFHPEDGVDMFLRIVRLTFIGLHGGVPQKRVLFMTAAVRTPCPAELMRINSEILS